MKVKITACNNPSRWYADMIGITVPAVSYNSDGNYICDLGIISEKDCVEVSDDKVFSMDKKSDPNALAWKGTPGPWRFVRQAHATIKTGRGMRYAVRSDFDGPEALKWLYDVRLDKVEDIALHQQFEANAHIISAAPEAIEFIADLVFALSNDGRYMFEANEWIKRGEEILKKAYNH